MKIEITNIIYDEDFCGELSVEKAMEIINDHPTELVIEFEYEQCDYYTGETFTQMSDELQKEYIRDIFYDYEIHISVYSFDYKVLVD